MKPPASHSDADEPPAQRSERGSLCSAHSHGNLGFALSICISSPSLPALLLSAMRRGEIAHPLCQLRFSPPELSEGGTALSSTRFPSPFGWIKPSCFLAAWLSLLCVEAEPVRWAVAGLPTGHGRKRMVACRARGSLNPNCTVIALPPRGVGGPPYWTPLLTASASS